MAPALKGTLPSFRPIRRVLIRAGDYPPRGLSDKATAESQVERMEEVGLHNGIRTEWLTQNLIYITWLGSYIYSEYLLIIRSRLIEECNAEQALCNSNQFGSGLPSFLRTYIGRAL